MSRHLTAVIIIGFHQLKTKGVNPRCHDFWKKVSAPSNCAPPEVESSLGDFYMSLLAWKQGAKSDFHVKADTSLEVSALSAC